MNEVQDLRNFFDMMVNLDLQSEAQRLLEAGNSEDALHFMALVQSIQEGRGEAGQSELDAANARAEKAEKELSFVQEVKQHEIDVAQELYRQQRDNFMTVYKYVSREAPNVWKAIKDKLIDMSPGEADKIMSWATRFEWQQTELSDANARAEKAEAEVARLRTALEDVKRSLSNNPHFQIKFDGYYTGKELAAQVDTALTGLKSEE